MRAPQRRPSAMKSASQFGREFKRYFGGTPAEEAAKLRNRLVGTTADL